MHPAIQNANAVCVRTLPHTTKIQFALESGAPLMAASTVWRGFALAERPPMNEVASRIIAEVLAEDRKPRGRCDHDGMCNLLQSLLER